MDTSETYIKMCREAREIQESWECEIGDWYINRTICVVCDHDPTDDSIWLPRQDQLQEMVGVKKLTWGWIPFLRFCVTGDWTINKYSLLFESMEQLWLAFVMKEKYNKTWNGETWNAI